MNDFQAIDRLYSTGEQASKAGWQIHQIDCADLSRFHTALRKFDSALRSEGIEEKWHSFLSYCKRLKHLVSTTPLPGSSIARYLGKRAPEASISLERLRGNLSYPSRSLYDQLNSEMQILQGQSENPLWAAARSNLQQTWLSDAEFAILHTQSGMTDLIRRFLFSEIGEIGTCWVLKPSEFKEAYVYDQIVVFGPPSRHNHDGSEFIYTSPRSEILTLFTPHIFPVVVPVVYGFAGSPHISPNCSLATFVEPIFYDCPRVPGSMDFPTCDEQENWLADLPEFVKPAQEWNRVSDEEQDTDPIRCRQVILSGDHAVFLADEGSIYRLNRSENESGSTFCSSIDYCDVRDLAHGDVLLFQGAGGGSLISEVADQILGADAPRLRALQRHWKEKLNKHVRTRGLEGVTRDLRLKGASIDTPMTVRNWCLDDNIGPGAWRNFEVLLGLLDLTSLQDDIFRATRLIRSAHKSAGFKLADRLLDMIQGKSLDGIKEQGWQEFTGSAKMSNRKIAYEITAVLHQTVDVHRSRVLHPFRIAR
jgi:hypothetical protein